MAARSIAGQRGRTDRHLCCRHSTDNSGYLFIYFLLLFSYPTLRLQPVQPDKLSCLGHLDRTTHITAHLPARPPAHLPTVMGNQKLPKCSHHLFSPVPKTPLMSLPLCHNSAASLAHGARSIWHVSPAPAQPPHVLSCHQPRWQWLLFHSHRRSKCLKQARERCWSVW